MLPNKFSDIAAIINAAEHPILILTQSEGCDVAKTQVQYDLEIQLQEHPDSVVYYSMCIPEQMMSFPRLDTPTLYYFLPGKQTPAFWRSRMFLNTLNDDLEIIKKMMTGKTYEEAKFSPEEVEHIIRVDYFLEQEKEIMSNFPSAFQMARNIAKEAWNTAKNVSKKLPILVSTEVGFARYSTCEGCEKFDTKTTRCQACGCYMRTKTQMASASCPLNKWDN